MRLRIVGKDVVLGALALGLHARFAVADLPLHCLPQDVFGEWEFESDSAPYDVLNACGHTTPNTVTSMLSLVGMGARERTIGTPPKERFTVTLTDRVEPASGRNSGPKLIALGSNGQKGSWTMVFDEGFEVRFGERSYAAKFEFEVMPGKQARDGDLLDKIGRFYGRTEGHSWNNFPNPVYGCHCDLTSIGWHSRPAPDTEWNRFRHGCFFARRVQPSNMSAVRVEGKKLEAPVVNSAAKATSSGKRLSRLLSISQRASGAGASSSRGARRPASVVWLENGGRKAFVRSGGDDVPLDASGGPWPPVPPGPSLLQPGPSLPAAFDWREQLDMQLGSTVGRRDVLATEKDQGGCGSCYAFASTLSLGMRFRIALAQRHRPMALDLSWRASTRCTPFAEGCSGGWPLFMGRMAREEGYFQQTTTVNNPLCRADQEASLIASTCDSTCLHPVEKAERQPVWFASDYGYVGGFAQGASEEAIMAEILEGGPVIFELATRTIPLFVYGNNGEVMAYFDNKETITDTVPRSASLLSVGGHLRAPNTTLSANAADGDVVPRALADKQSANLHDWIWVDHVILAVGWGQDSASALRRTQVLATRKQASLLQQGLASDLKYWLIRNSWGDSWGSRGYGKLVRGVNAGGVEMSAVWIRPDMSRPGFARKNNTR